MFIEWGSLSKNQLDFFFFWEEYLQNEIFGGHIVPISANDILSRAKQENVHFLRLQFTDIDGIIKNVEVPASQFEKALDGQIMLHGSSI